MFEKEAEEYVRKIRHDVINWDGAEPKRDFITNCGGRRMTDKEKAREWVRTNSGYSTKEFHGKKAIEAFLAGLEAGKDMAEADFATIAWEHYEEGQNDSKALEQAYLAGAQFGYNKANEWHFVKDGIMPEENQWVLVYDGSYTVCNYHSNTPIKWLDNYENEVYEYAIIAWREIVPPKEIKEK